MWIQPLLWNSCNASPTQRMIFFRSTSNRSGLFLIKDSRVSWKLGVNEDALVLIAVNRQSKSVAAREIGSNALGKIKEGPWHALVDESLVFTSGSMY